MKITFLALHEGEKIPFGYGVAYWDFRLDAGIFYPMPLNVFIRLGRLVYFVMMRGLFPDYFHATVIKARLQISEKAEQVGYEKGWRACLANYWGKILDNYLKAEVE